MPSLSSPCRFPGLPSPCGPAGCSWNGLMPCWCNAACSACWPSRAGRPWPAEPSPCSPTAPRPTHCLSACLGCIGMCAWRSIGIFPGHRRAGRPGREPLRSQPPLGGAGRALRLAAGQPQAASGLQFHRECRHHRHGPGILDDLPRHGPRGTGSDWALGRPLPRAQPFGVQEPAVPRRGFDAAPGPRGLPE